MKVIKIFLILMFLLLLPFCKKQKPVREEKPAEYSIFRTTIKRGETVEIALKNLTNDQQLTTSILNTLKIFEFPFRRCKPGDSIFVLKKNGNFEKFTYYQGPTVIYYILKDNSHLVGAMKHPFIEKSMVIIAGSIQSTLYESMLKIGETPELVYKFVDIFAWEIDFTTETQEGDSFFVLAEKSFAYSQFIGYKNISFVRYKGMVGDYYGIY